MSAQVTGSGAIVPADAVTEHVHALLDLAAAAHAIGPHSSTHARERLNNAVSKVLRMFRLHGLAAAPLMSQQEAVETFRHALRLALAARAPRRELAAIFNGEEDEPEQAVRRDLQ